MKIVIKEGELEPKWPRLYVDELVTGVVYLIQRHVVCGGPGPYRYSCMELRSGNYYERNSIDDLRPLPSGSTVELTQD